MLGMAFWNRKKAIVDVTFHEGAPGGKDTRAFAQASVPVDQLPQTFELSTQMQLEGADWEVIDASPQTRAEFEKTGSLDLYMARVQSASPGEIRFTQLDITDDFGPPAGASRDTWIDTVAINTRTDAGGKSGLPPADATEDEVYEAAPRMSAIREEIGVEGDGVYCPACHIANIDYARLGEPCPRCSRGLLAFGWD